MCSRNCGTLQQQSLPCCLVPSLHLQTKCTSRTILLRSKHMQLFARSKLARFSSSSSFFVFCFQLATIVQPTDVAINTFQTCTNKNLFSRLQGFNVSVTIMMRCIIVFPLHKGLQKKKKKNMVSCCNPLKSMEMHSITITI